jgi:hypothetical protein
LFFGGQGYATLFSNDHNLVFSFESFLSFFQKKVQMADEISSFTLCSSSWPWSISRPFSSILSFSSSFSSSL